MAVRRKGVSYGRAAGRWRLILDFHLTYVFLLWIAFLYLVFSLLLAVITGRFIRFGEGIDQSQAPAFRQFADAGSPSSGSVTYKDDPTPD